MLNHRPFFLFMFSASILAREYALQPLSTRYRPFDMIFLDDDIYDGDFGSGINLNPRLKEFVSNGTSKLNIHSSNSTEFQKSASESRPSVMGPLPPRTNMSKETVEFTHENVTPTRKVHKREIGLETTIKSISSTDRDHNVVHSSTDNIETGNTKSRSTIKITLSLSCFLLFILMFAIGYDMGKKKHPVRKQTTGQRQTTSHPIMVTIKEANTVNIYFREVPVQEAQHKVITVTEDCVKV